MPKRMTVTEKWNDEWFISLSPQAKVMWEYMRDNCDLSGVWEVNVELLKFRVKFSSQVDIWKHLAELNEVAHKLGMEDRVQWFSDKKRVWIVNFIRVQYGVLSENSSTHRGVIKVIMQNSLAKGLPKGYLTLIGTVKDKVKAKVIKKETVFQKDGLGMDVVMAAQEKAEKDQRWMEAVCIANSIKKPEHLGKWLYKFSASLAQDYIENFNDATYRKMFGGWLYKQQANGISLNEPPEPVANSNYRLKKIS